MKRVLRFENGKSYRLYKCPKCYMETKPIPYFFKDEQIIRNNSKTANKPTKKRGK